MRWAGLVLALSLTACSEAIPVNDFHATTPAIDPIRFFSGHVKSWGVLENRSGQPTSVVTTDCIGNGDGDTLNMTQRLSIGQQAPTARVWQMRRAGPGRYEATANDMIGIAVGEASGRAFHWTWTLATSPGNSLKNVLMDQWWYLLDDGSMLNRTTVSKFGVALIEVSEHFAHVS